MAETLDQTSTYRISRDGNDNGYGAGCSLGGLSRWCIHRDDDIHIESDKLGSERTETIDFTTRIPVLNRDVLSLNPAEVLESLSKRVYLIRNRGIGLAGQKAYSRDIPWPLLAIGRKGQRRRTTKEADELAPSHCRAPGSELRHRSGSLERR
jgi:hypothetical protein